MLKAMIDNKIVKVKIIDNNYNDDSKEVQILEGTHKDKYAIINNNDIIIDSYKQLVKLCKLDIVNIEDIKEHHFAELISNSTYNTIKKFSRKCNLSKSDYYKLLEYYKYESCSNIDEIKESLLIDSIESNFNGIKASFTSIKNKALKEVY